MKTHFFTLAMIASLTACGSGGGGNPFDVADEETTDTGTDTDTDTAVATESEGTGINRDGIPPGTDSPTPSSALFRSEPTVDGDGVDSGNGFANGISYTEEGDLFTVDNLAFDGDRPYSRVDDDGNANVVTSLNNGLFNVYEGPSTAVDPVSGDIINQFTYRAIYGVSQNRVAGTDTPTTQFAIVRTGTYVDYGFGGFIYQRDTDVTLPSSLQAVFTGQSAGLRDFGTQTGLQYTTADVSLAFDFEDFNDGELIRGDGVNGRIFNRRVIDLEGNDITNEVAASIGDGETSIPDVSFEVGPDVLDNNGDLITNIQSRTSDGEDYETGTFYAIVSGDNPDEVVGVFVLEANDDAQSRDTGGFIVYRGDPE